MKQTTDETLHSLELKDNVAGAYSSDLENDTREVVVPVIQEQIEVHKVLRNTGTVRIWKTVHDRQETVNETLASEKVDVERVPKNQIIDTLPSVRTEGDVTVIPVVEEVIVVTKQLRLVEELRITKRKSMSDYHEVVTVRAEELHVERVGAESSLQTEVNEIKN